MPRGPPCVERSRNVIPAGSLRTGRQPSSLKLLARRHREALVGEINWLPDVKGRLQKRPLDDRKRAHYLITHFYQLHQSTSSTYCDRNRASF